VRVADRDPVVYSYVVPDIAALLRPPAWHADALCKEIEYRDLGWFPERGVSADQVAAAETVCSHCIVRAECLAAGVEGDEHGIWGGVDRGGRRRSSIAVSAA
jgi:hypothetical protein